MLENYIDKKKLRGMLKEVLTEKHILKIKPIKAYAIVKNNKIDVLNIYKDKDVVLNKDEKLVLVEIKVNKRV